MKTILSLACAAVIAAASLPVQAQTISPLRRPAQTPATAPATTAPAAAPAQAPSAATPDKPAPSRAQLAQRNRMKQCGAEWQAMKKAGKTKGKTWREFSSDCLSKN